VVRESWRALWAEPRPADVPVRVWRDWALVAILVPAALLEGILSPDVVWRPVATLVAVALVPVLLWRRTHPLACVLVGFGAGAVLTLAQAVTGSGPIGLYTMIYILVLVYSVVRWGSGREVVLGLAVIFGAATLSYLVAYTGPADLFGGYAILLFAAAAGAAFRYRSESWRRALEQLRSQERVGLARELHDTVAHHVSAIAVQAQAGRAVAASRPEAALEALAAIEGEASRTLEEMRGMVRVLRDGAAAEYAPQPGVADLVTLARPDTTPVVEVVVSGEVDGLAASVDAAAYRLAQESLTNALRHARGATRVAIEVVADASVVRVRVTDDGAADPGHRVVPGFGLLGMRERAELLGGTLSAGPGPAGGWTVDAQLPRVAPA
jgi:signal transduction histidine kinase